MQCAHCKQEAPDDAKFCPKCGFSLAVQDTATMSGASIGTYAATASAGQPAGSPRGRKLIFIVAAIVAVLAIAAAGAAWYFVDQHNREVAQQQWNAAHQEYAVELTFAAEGYSPSSASPVPIRVEGTDFEGNAVSKECLVAGKSGGTLSLMRGTYTVQVVSTPVTDDGTIYDVSQASCTIDVSDDASASNSSADTLTLTPIGPLSMTDEQIQAACDALLAAGVTSDEAQGYQDAATSRMQTAQAEEAARQEEAARIAQAEEEARQEEAARAERAAQKATFESEWATLQAEYATASEESQRGSQSDMNVCSAEYCQKYETFMEEVCTYLYEVLSADEASTLQAEQTSWMADRKAQMEAARQEAAGGTLAPLLYNGTGIELATPRITELIGMIPT